MVRRGLASFASLSRGRQFMYAVLSGLLLALLLLYCLTCTSFIVRRRLDQEGLLSSSETPAPTQTPTPLVLSTTTPAPTITPVTTPQGE